MVAVTTSELLLEQAVELLTEVRDLLRQGSTPAHQASQSVTASPATEDAVAKAARKTGTARKV